MFLLKSFWAHELLFFGPSLLLVFLLSALTVHFVEKPWGPGASSLLRAMLDALPGMVHGLDQVAAHRIPIVSGNKEAWSKSAVAAFGRALKCLKAFQIFQVFESSLQLRTVRSVLLVILENPEGSDSAACIVIGKMRGQAEGKRWENWAYEAQ